MKRATIQILLLGLCLLAWSLGAACSCGTIAPPKCDRVNSEQHPDWQEIQKFSNAASSAASGIDTCMQVAWGDTDASAPSEAVAQHLKYYKGRLIAKGSSGNWDQTPSLNLPPRADGKQFRFTVFFIRPRSARTLDMDAHCNNKVTDVVRYTCLSQPDCMAAYRFVPQGFDRAVFPLTSKDNACQFILRELPTEGTSGELVAEPNSEPNSEPNPEPPKEVMSDEPDSREPVIDEVKGEPLATDAGEPVPEPDVSDAVTCQGPSVWPKPKPPAGPPLKYPSWSAHGGGTEKSNGVTDSNADNGVISGGIATHMVSGDIFVGGQMEGFLPLFSNQGVTYGNSLPTPAGCRMNPQTCPLAKAYVAKLDRKGEWKAVVTSSGEMNSQVNAIAIDQRSLAAQGGSLSLYAGGVLKRNGSSTFFFFAGAALPLSGKVDGRTGFLAKIRSSANRLSVDWVAGVGGEEDTITSVVVDAFGDILVAGIVRKKQGQATFDVKFVAGGTSATRPTITRTLTKDLGYYIAKISSKGLWKWAEIFYQNDLNVKNTLNTNGWDGPPRLALAPQTGEIWVAGAFWGNPLWGTPRWKPQKPLATGRPLAAFVLKFERSFDMAKCEEDGLKLIAQVKAESTVAADMATRIGAIDVDSKGDLYVAGSCNGDIESLDFQQSAIVQKCGTNNIFVSKILTHPSGPDKYLSWQPAWVSGDNDNAQGKGEIIEVRGLAVDPSGDDVYVTGITLDQVTFAKNPSAPQGVSTHSPRTALLGYGVFLAKLRFFGVPNNVWSWEWVILGGRANSAGSKDRTIRGLGVALSRSPGGNIPIHSPVLLGRMADEGSFLGYRSTSEPPNSSVFVVKVTPAGKTQ